MARKEEPEEEQSNAVALLKAGCMKAKKKPVSFFFCAAGSDGEPVLLVGKRIQTQIKAVRATAKEKKYVRGMLTFEGGKFVFQADKPGEARFARALRETFGKDFAPLKSALIVAQVEADAPPALKDELAAEIARRETRKETREAQASGDDERLWRARYKEFKADLRPKLDLLIGAEQAIATRLESGSTEKVRERLVKSQERLERLIAQAHRLLAEVRA